MAERLMPIEASRRNTTWILQGACRSSSVHADSWFPDDDEDRFGVAATAARKVCSGCEVQEDCLQDAMSWMGTVGIWGGQDEKERRATSRRGKRHA